MPNEAMRKEDGHPFISLRKTATLDPFGSTTSFSRDNYLMLIHGRLVTIK